MLIFPRLSTYTSLENRWNGVNFRKLGQLDYSITIGGYFIRFILNSMRNLTTLSTPRRDLRFQRHSEQSSTQFWSTALLRIYTGRNVYSYPFLSPYYRCSYANPFQDLNRTIIGVIIRCPIDPIFIIIRIKNFILSL
jgi:hypothetical protein